MPNGRTVALPIDVAEPAIAMGTGLVGGGIQKVAWEVSTPLGFITQPFEELVVELYMEHRTYEGVAKALGISRQTLQIWLRLVGLGSRDLRLGALERRKRATTRVRAGNPED